MCLYVCLCLCLCLCCVLVLCACVVCLCCVLLLCACVCACVCSCVVCLCLCLCLCCVLAFVCVPWCVCPRTAWAFDYHGVARSEDGYCEILGGIDLVTAEIRLFATKCRTAAVTTDYILQGVVLRDGVPLVIHSDHAREFISKTLKAMATALGVKTTTTLAHHPTGNSKIERIWQYVTKCLRCLSAKQHRH